MGGNEIRKKFLEFMEKRQHAVIPSFALVPENDPTTLFTSSGMQPLVPYLMGEKHPKGVRLANSQKCFRANDIDEVGDNRHTTFFEMLGNWSLGDYFKKEQLRSFFTFLVDEVGLSPERIYVTVFAGDEKLGIPADEESVKIWQELFLEKGIEAKAVFIGSEEDGYKKGMQGGRIFYYNSEKNWWSRSGIPENMPEGEIGGPDSEVFYDFGVEFATDLRYKDLEPHPNSDSGQFVEIGNSVFIEYIKQKDGTFAKLPHSNVDFGGGLERITAAKLGDPDVFKIDLLATIIKGIEEISGKKYEENQLAFRIVADHLRGAVFMIGDGVFPGNEQQGYFVRRLLRRAIRQGDNLNVPEGKITDLAEKVIAVYKDYYTNLLEKRVEIKEVIKKEEEQFRLTLEKALKEFKKVIAEKARAVDSEIFSPEILFKFITTFGFPKELIIEEAEVYNISIPEKTWQAVEKLLEEHKEKSRAGAEHKFKGGLADHSEKVVQYHTTTHLLLAGLRKELGDHVHQAGSNITGERLRFDFTHAEKVPREVLDKVENFVNNAIKVGGGVEIEFLGKEKAKADKTIEASFWERYPDEVKVYTIKGNDGEIFSRELCGGPHVEKLEKISGTFKIVKEESSSAGVRRIKGILE